MSKSGDSHTRWLLREMNFDPCSFEDYGKLGNGSHRNQSGDVGSCFLSSDEPTKKMPTPSKKRESCQAQKKKKKKEEPSKEN